MVLRSPRMPDFSPIVIWMRRWVYSIVFPPFFTIRGQGATSNTTSRRCYVNRYTAASLAMKMSTMPIAYRLIRLCGGITGKKLDDKNAASANTMGRFETKMLSVEDNLQALSEVNGRWVERALQKTTHRRIILDMDSSASPVHGEQEASAYNGHFGCTCYHPLFCFNQFGDCEGSLLRPGNVHSADRWKELLEPIVARYERKTVRKYFRGDAAFAKPEIYEYLEEKGFLYAIRLPANQVLQEKIEHLLTRPVGRPPRKPVVWFADFKYQAASWDRPRRVIGKVEWHRGELFPRVGFIVTNRSARAQGVVHFYNGRGRTEQWIKEGKYALNWTRLSCQHFVSNQVRLALFVLAYNLGNFLRRLVLPRRIKHWSLRTLLSKLIKIGAKVVRHSRMVTFQMAEVAVSKEVWAFTPPDQLVFSTQTFFRESSHLTR